MITILRHYIALELLRKTSMDTRHKIIDSWRQKGLIAQENEEYFDAFISYWISFVVSCKVYCDNNGVKICLKKDQKYPTDFDFLIAWFNGNSKNVFNCFENNMQSLSILKDRNKGEILKNASIGQFRSITHALQGERIQKNILVENIAYFINQIRNNLFHGTKIYDDHEDLQLIKSVLPLLRDLLDDSVNKSY